MAKRPVNAVAIHTDKQNGHVSSSPIARRTPAVRRGRVFSATGCGVVVSSLTKGSLTGCRTFSSVTIRLTLNTAAPIITRSPAEG